VQYTTSLDNLTIVKNAVHIDNDDQHQYKIIHRLPLYMKTMFLPINFPSSVHPCYLKHHSWLLLESAFASAINCLVQQAMLEGLGVGASPAAAGGLAIAVQWVLKEG
jgi:hypothetical protein